MLKGHMATRGMVGSCLAVVGMTLAVELYGQDHAAEAPPGRLVDVGGYRLHIDCRGIGAPTVVVDVGAGAWSIFFSHIQQTLAEEVQVCTYDRAGMGWSDPGPLPRTRDRMVQELHALLTGAGVPPRYVLVGHSLGGLNVRAFAAHYEEDVAGVVLVESAHEDQWRRLPPEAHGALRTALGRLHHAAIAARAGQLDSERVPAGPFPSASPEVKAYYRAAMMTPKPYEGFAAEIEAILLEPDARVAARPLGDMPLAIVTAGNSFAAFENSGIPREKANAVWMELQSELTTLSTNVAQFVSESSDHRIYAADPDIVIRATRYVVDAVRSSPKAGIVHAQLARVLPRTSTPEVDGLLKRIEETYGAMALPGSLRSSPTTLCSRTSTGGSM